MRISKKLKRKFITNKKIKKRNKNKLNVKMIEILQTLQIKMNQRFQLNQLKSYSKILFQKKNTAFFNRFFQEKL